LWVAVVNLHMFVLIPYSFFESRLGFPVPIFKRVFLQLEVVYSDYIVYSPV
jgi:hypothetical protein